MTPTRFELAHLTIVETSAKSEEELTTLESTALDQLGHSVYLLKVENTWFSGQCVDGFLDIQLIMPKTPPTSRGYYCHNIAYSH